MCISFLINFVYANCFYFPSIGSIWFRSFLVLDFVPFPALIDLLLLLCLDVVLMELSYNKKFQFTFAFMTLLIQIISPSHKR